MTKDADVTQLLAAWRSGDRAALDALVPVVYRELHRLARGAMRGERPGHTLQTTALVHEAFLHLADAQVDWRDRAHFFAVAARQMRRILVNHALEKKAAKRGGGAPQASLDEALDVVGTPSAAISDLDDALKRLEKFDERKARILELHYFGGLTFDEMSVVTNLSIATLDAELRFAKAWLRMQLADGPPPSTT
ncbi:MAG TPA: sigma-70 family RNA polymerase sigma factor [Burkholderiaceae bacterium]|nr:sigma-70 family RNA polymerase sigma factor [Burkholderiaceae bacterium]HSB98975.1 sigma-70 family RNA polymerase sigma factor [Burkholderiaceae bacterium]